MAFSTKLDARAATQKSRAVRADAELATLGQALAQHDWQVLIGGNRATAYVSMRAEPNTSDLLATLEQLAISVWVPIMEKGRALAWGQFTHDLAVNSFGVAEPAADEDFSLDSVSALIIPAQRAGRDGTRLGRGAGYYDRALELLPTYSDGGPKRIVVVFDDEVDDSVPHDSWDQTMDVIVTPHHIYDIKK